MEIFDDEVAARERAAGVYARLIEQAFGPGGRVRPPWISPGNVSVYAQYTVEVDEREIVETRMKALGVPTAVHYPMSLHEQPVFGYLGQAAGSFPVSEAAARRGAQSADASVPDGSAAAAGGCGAQAGDRAGRRTESGERLVTSG